MKRTVACLCGKYGLYEEPCMVDGKLKLRVLCLYCDYHKVKDMPNKGENGKTD